MRYRVTVLTFWVSILGVISKDISSAVNKERNEELDLHVNGNILNRQIRADMALDRKKGSGKKPKPSKDSWIVTTGGDNNETHWSSSEIIGYLGVCSNPHIQNLEAGTVGGQSAWLPNIDTLLFCGGSNDYTWGSADADAYGATDKCFTLKPGKPWIDNGDNYMKSARGWFSLTRVGKGRVIAAGGHDGDGNALDSLELYSKSKASGKWGWKIMDITLDNPIYGHCAVHFEKRVKKKMQSYLLLIGGSSDPVQPVIHPDKCDLSLSSCKPNAGYATLINLATKDVEQVDPWPLPPLWAPACTKLGDNVYVSGGASHDDSDSLFPTNGVYKYNIKTTKWSEVGNFINSRWGHIMGKTSQGQMVIAGGWTFSNTVTTFNNIEASDDKGITWAVKQPGLKTGGQYMAMAQVPADTFKCNLVEPGVCRPALCNNIGDCDEGCAVCTSYGWPWPDYFGVCEYVFTSSK